MEKRTPGVVVLSDLHLGTYGCRAKEIVAYLKSISPQLLILNGDIIDMWQFSKHYFPSSHMSVIREIFHLLSNGTRVVYITGNHDELMRRYSDLELGNLQIVDKMVIEIDGKKTWLFHGDVFDNTSNSGAKFWSKLGSNGYAILLGLNRMINSFLRFSSREPISFSKKIMNRFNRSWIKIDRFELLVSELAIHKKYDYVICGHIHQPQKRIVATEQGSTTYLNSGDWVDNLTSLEYYEKDWHINTFSGTQSPATTESREFNSNNVISNEVNIYLHLLED